MEVAGVHDLNLVVEAALDVLVDVDIAEVVFRGDVAGVLGCPVDALPLVLLQHVPAQVLKCALMRDET